MYVQFFNHMSLYNQQGLLKEWCVLTNSIPKFQKSWNLNLWIFVSFVRSEVCLTTNIIGQRAKKQGKITATLQGIGKGNETENGSGGYRNLIVTRMSNPSPRGLLSWMFHLFPYSSTPDSMVGLPLHNLQKIADTHRFKSGVLEKTLKQMSNSRLEG